MIDITQKHWHLKFTDGSEARVPPFGQMVIFRAERHFNKTWLQLSQDDAGRYVGHSQEVILWCLMHSCSKQTGSGGAAGKTLGGFEAFIDEIDDYELVDPGDGDAEDEDPTSPTRES